MKLLANGNLTENFDADCPATRDLLTRVGDKWSVLLVVILGEGPARFGELKRALEGISHKVLTQALRGLERDGLVDREVSEHSPPRVRYGLTTLGKTLLEPVKMLAVWANDHRAEVYHAREHFDRATQGESRVAPGPSPAASRDPSGTNSNE